MVRSTCLTIWVQYYCVRHMDPWTATIVKLEWWRRTDRSIKRRRRRCREACFVSNPDLFEIRRKGFVWNVSLDFSAGSVCLKKLRRIDIPKIALHQIFTERQMHSIPIEIWLNAKKIWQIYWILLTHHKQLLWLWFSFFFHLIYFV